MCLAVPGEVIKIEPSETEGKLATVSFGGVRRQVCIDFVPDVKPGEYVLVHAGFALNIIDEKEAAETLNLISEVSGMDD